MSRPWMPFYVSDYLADTGHLSCAEHGAYLMLIMHYWQKGSLPNDDKRLASIARATPEQWASMKATLSEFFTEAWRHKRIEAELEKSKQAYERRALAGKKGGISKASNAVAMPEQCSSNHSTLLYSTETLTDTLTDSSLRSESSPSSAPKPPERTNGASRLPPAVISDFETFWQAWPHKVGKGAARKAFEKAAKKTSIQEILLAVDRYAVAKPRDRPWCNPATWLNQERWLDVEGAPPRHNVFDRIRELNANGQTKSSSDAVCDVRPGEGDGPPRSVFDSIFGPRR